MPNPVFLPKEWVSPLKELGEDIVDLNRHDQERSVIIGAVTRWLEGSGNTSIVKVTYWNAVEHADLEQLIFISNIYAGLIDV